MTVNGADYDASWMSPLFEVPFSLGVHNFAVSISWIEAKIAVYYSNDNDALIPVAYRMFPLPQVPVSLNVGLQKYPLEDGTQESDISEAVLYGGIFVENSFGGAVTTEPWFY